MRISARYHYDPQFDIETRIESRFGSRQNPRTEISDSQIRDEIEDFLSDYVQIINVRFFFAGRKIGVIVFSRPDPFALDVDVRHPSWRITRRRFEELHEIFLEEMNLTFRSCHVYDDGEEMIEAHFPTFRSFLTHGGRFVSMLSVVLAAALIIPITAALAVSGILERVFAPAGISVTVSDMLPILLSEGFGLLVVVLATFMYVTIEYIRVSGLRYEVLSG